MPGAGPNSPQELPLFLFPETRGATRSFASDLHLVHYQTFNVLDHIVLGNIVDCPVVEAHSANRIVREGLHEKRVLRLARSQAAYLDVTYDRVFGTFVSGIVIKID